MRIQMVRQASEIPVWVDSYTMENLQETFDEDEDDDRGSALVVAFDGSDKAEVYWDGGEPEDQFFFRDWSWVEDVINRAYEAGQRVAGSGTNR